MKMITVISLGLALCCGAYAAGQAQPATPATPPAKNAKNEKTNKNEKKNKTVEKETAKKKKAS